MKCAHPGCKCDVPYSRQYGNYCSEHCRQLGDKVEPHCECHHAACNNTK